MATLRNKNEDVLVRWVRALVVVYLAVFLGLTSSGSKEATHSLLHVLTPGDCTESESHVAHETGVSVVLSDVGHSVCSLDVLAKSATPSVLLCSNGPLLRLESHLSPLILTMFKAVVLAQETIDWSSSRGPPAIA